MGNVIGLSCPSCGGTLEVKEGIRNVFCPFCGSSFILSSKIGAERYYVEPVIRNYRKKITELTGKKDFLDLDLFFVPIIRVRCEIFGWFYAFKEGKRKTVYEDTYSPTTGRKVRRARTIIEGRERIKKGVNVMRDAILHPAKNPPMGLSRIELEGLKLLPYDDEKTHTFGSVLDLPDSIDFYMKEGIDKIIKGITNKYKNFDEFYYSLEPVAPHMTIVYYPIAFARFPDGVITYDTVKGKILLKQLKDRKKKLNIPLTKLLPVATLIVSISSLYRTALGIILFLAFLGLFILGDGNGD